MTTRATSSIHVRSADRITAYHYRHHPFDLVGWDGYLWPFRFNIARLPADHRARPPAAAGPPDVPGTQLRRVLVRAPQVRLPPARDPGAVQPLEHQLRRGHLLRRGQLHEPARRGDRVVHAPPGRASRTGRTRARSRRRSARRPPRSWRSWSTRSTRSTSRRRRWTSTTGATRSAGCRPRTTPKEASELAERGPEAFPD